MGEELERRINGFSALQRAEIAENPLRSATSARRVTVSVLFNEPKLLKTSGTFSATTRRS